MIIRLQPPLSPNGPLMIQDRDGDFLDFIESSARLLALLRDDVVLEGFRTRGGWDIAPRLERRR
ncbi:MAG: hypothetical protein AB7M12_10785 [Hyphomonadaceae bacterium]